MKIVWTDFAKRELKDIYDYYKFKASKRVANRIVKDIRKSVQILKSHQAVGQVEEYLEALNLDHRYIIEGNFKVIYRIENNQIYITDVFDTRQNPDSMIERN